MEGSGADMLIALHKNATTTPAIRAALQRATGSDYELAREFKLSRETVRKWCWRDGVHDASHTAHRLQTTLNAGQEKLVIYLSEPPRKSWSLVGLSRASRAKHERRGD